MNKVLYWSCYCIVMLLGYCTINKVVGPIYANPLTNLGWSLLWCALCVLVLRPILQELFDYYP